MASHFRPTTSPTNPSTPDPDFAHLTNLTTSQVDQGQLDVLLVDHLAPAAVESFTPTLMEAVALPPLSTTEAGTLTTGDSAAAGPKTPADFTAIANGAANLLSSNLPLRVFPASQQTTWGQVATMQDLAAATSPATLEPLVRAAVQPAIANFTRQAINDAVGDALDARINQANNPIMLAIERLGERIDTRFDRLEDRVGRLEDRVVQLEDRVVQLEHRVDGFMGEMGNRMDEMSNRMDEMGDRLNLNTTRILNAQTRAQNLVHAHPVTGEGTLAPILKTVEGYGPGIHEANQPHPGDLAEDPPAVGEIPPGNLFPVSLNRVTQMTDRQINTLAIFYNENFNIAQPDTVQTRRNKFLAWATVGPR